MLSALLLAGSLWAASQEVRQGDPFVQATIVAPIEQIGDAVAIDLALLGIGAGADLISTDYAVNHGGHEANPLAPRTEGRVALKMGAGALRGSLAYFLRRTGHKGTANVVRWLGLTFDIGVSVHNVQVGRRGSK